MPISKIGTNSIDQAANTSFCETSGNFGIGTNNPTEKLYVVGNIVAGGTIFTGDGANTEDTSIELGAKRTGSGNCYVDLHATAGADFSARLLRYTGVNGVFEISNAGTGPLTFNLNNAERMRIDSSGNFAIANTNPAAVPNSGFIFQPAWTATGNGSFAVGHVSGSASGSRYGVFAFNSGEIGSITQNGTTGVNYNTSSDYRLKENIAPMTGALAKVSALKPVTYTWKADNSDGQGFIAHELAEVVPDAVTGEKDAVDADGNPQYQGIDTSFLVATLTAALQEAHGLIKDLQARVEALEQA
jgi:hypothetical protein